MASESTVVAVDATGESVGVGSGDDGNGDGDGDGDGEGEGLGVRCDVQEFVGLLDPNDFWRMIDTGRWVYMYVCTMLCACVYACVCVCVRLLG